MLGFAMASVIGLLSPVATPPAPEDAPPSWIADTYAAALPPLLAAAGAAFGESVGATLNVTMGDADLAVRNILAEARPGRIEIRLRGRGWAGESDAARASLLLNLAHEVAHLAQLQARDDPAEPRWLHEGAAEAIGLELLAATGLVPAPERTRARRDHTARCGVALRRGPLEPQLGGHDDADYGCGFVLVRAAADAAGISGAALYRHYSLAEGFPFSFGPAAETAVGPSFLGQASLFVGIDWRHTDPQSVIRRFRAGRL